MFAAIQKTQPWIYTTSTVKPGSRRIDIRVNIINNSISRSFLILEDISDSSNVFFMPITSDINIKYAGSIIIFTFKKHENVVLPLSIDDYLQMELLISHFSQTQLLTNDEPDLFRTQNIRCLKIWTVPNFKSPITNTTSKSISSILNPIVFSKSAKHIWSKSVIEQNSQFYMQKFPFRISFFTWNLDGNKPTEKIISAIQKSFISPAAPNDVVIITFQNVGSIDKHAIDEVITSSIMRFRDAHFQVVHSGLIESLYACLLIRHESMNLVTLGSSRELKLVSGNGQNSVIFYYLVTGISQVVIACCNLAPSNHPNNATITQIEQIVSNSIPADYFFIAGALNFIIPTGEYFKNDLNRTLASEPLTQAFQNVNALKGFTEAQIKFNPTSLLLSDSDEYDTAQVPSYTDRVIVKSGDLRIRVGLDDQVVFETDAPKLSITEKGFFDTDCCFTNPFALNFPMKPDVICYQSLPERYSQHRPVHCIYKLLSPVTDKERLKEIGEIQEAKFEEMVRLSKPRIEFGTDCIVRGSTDRIFDLKMSNKSLVWANWSVKEAHGAITISPTMGTLIAGQSGMIRISFGANYNPSSTYFVIQTQRAGDQLIRFAESGKEPPKHDVVLSEELKLEKEFVPLPLAETHFKRQQKRFSDVF